MKSIMKVIDRSIRKALNKKFLPDATETQLNMYNSDKEKENRANTILFNILTHRNVTHNDIQFLNTCEPGIVQFQNTTSAQIAEQLKKVVEFYEENYPNDSLNWFDISEITDMSYMFKDSHFNGDISKWDVSNIRLMQCMFSNSIFNNNISGWNVSNVISMHSMFRHSLFNQDISRWDVSNVTDMACMFRDSKFNGDISKWNVSNVTDMNSMFANSSFNRDISKWNIDLSKLMDYCNVFNNSPMKSSFKPIIFRRYGE